MRTAIASLESVAPYSQSRPVEAPKLNAKETAADYEFRTWREKAHADAEGRIYIPPMAFKMAVDTAAKMLGERIPGKGQSTFSKFFTSGVLVLEPLRLPLHKDQLQCNRIFANADGKRGSGKRVWRHLPRIDSWKGNVEFAVLADEIPEDVFQRTLQQAGSFVGLGQFRPENGGYYGRFRVAKIKWQ